LGDPELAFALALVEGAPLAEEAALAGVDEAPLPIVPGVVLVGAGAPMVAGAPVVVAGAPVVVAGAPVGAGPPIVLTTAVLPAKENDSTVVQLVSEFAATVTGAD